MSLARTARKAGNWATVMMIGALAAVAVTAQPAQAVVNPATCGYSTDPFLNKVTATCTNTTQTGWYVRVGCETSTGAIVYHNGTVVYGTVATGRCSISTDLSNWIAVNV